MAVNVAVTLQLARWRYDAAPGGVRYTDATTSLEIAFEFRYSSEAVFWYYLR